MMVLMAIVLACWLFIFIFLDHFFEKSKQAKPEPLRSDQTSLAVVIAARNEEANIERLLASIENQNWLPPKTTVYIADDHSDDKTAAVVDQLEDRFKKFQLVFIESTEGTGKKAALKNALNQITADYYYFTDADCELSDSVIFSMVLAMDSEKVQAAFGSVLIQGEGWWNSVVKAENLNNQVVTTAFLNAGNPIMANGANIMISAGAKDMLGASYSSKTQSGDDTFFAQSLSSGSFKSVVHESAVVWTAAPKSFCEFFNQRVRWASKSVHYQSLIAKGFAALTVSLSSLWLLIIGSLAINGWWPWFFVVVLAKLGIEYPFHRKWFATYDHLHTIPVALMLSILHPMYVCVIGGLSVLGIGYTWKGRKFKR